MGLKEQSTPMQGNTGTENQGSGIKFSRPEDTSNIRGKIGAQGL